MSQPPSARIPSRRALTAALAATLMALPAAPALADAPLPEQKAFEDQLRSALPAPKPRPVRAPASPKADPAVSAATAPLSDGDAGGKLGTTTMRRANRVAAEILKQRMERERPDDLRLVREAVGADVVVVKGSYDRVQDVLAAVDVKHVVIPPHLLDRIDLLPTQTLMVNCGAKVSPMATTKISDFVKRGGYLVTTDWALGLTQRAFPGTIAHNLRRTKNDVVAVHVHDQNEPLLRHVKVMKEQPRWWLESSSYPIRVLDRKKVRVLMSSQEMGEKYGDKAVVVAFRVDDGKVLHMTSHFFLQQAKLVAKNERKKGSSFAKAAGLSDKEVQAVKKKTFNFDDDVVAGELNSAYSMQQVSTNLLVEKQRANIQLLKKYSGRIKSDGVSLGNTGKGGGAAPTRLNKNYRVQILEDKGKTVKVRDLFGNEGEVPSDSVAR